MMSDERVEKAIDAGVKAGEHAAYKERCTLGHSIELACRAAIEAYRKAEPAQRLEATSERDELASMLSDMLDGVSRPHDIEHSTGLPIERCQQISKWFNERSKRNG